LTSLTTNSSQRKRELKSLSLKILRATKTYSIYGVKIYRNKKDDIDYPESERIILGDLNKTKSLDLTLS